MDWVTRAKTSTSPNTAFHFTADQNLTKSIENNLNNSLCCFLHRSRNESMSLRNTFLVVQQYKRAHVIFSLSECVWRPWDQCEDKFDQDHMLCLGSILVCGKTEEYSTKSMINQLVLTAHAKSLVQAGVRNGIDALLTIHNLIHNSLYLGHCWRH